MTTNASFSRRALLGALPAAVALGATRGGADLELRTRTLVLVRHAEKVAESGDPDISETGIQRAQKLAELLGASPVTQLFASQFKRTAQTLEPLAVQASLDITRYDARDPASLVTAIGALDEADTIVVAGHSNTVPDLAARFGGSINGLDARGFLDESEYDRVVVQALLSLGERGPWRALSTLDLRVTLSSG